MKIRSGFVSNSSSSSFVLYGIELDKDEFFKDPEFIKFLESSDVLNEYDGDTVDEKIESYVEDSYIGELLDTLIYNKKDENKPKLDYATGDYYSESIWIGFTPYAIPEDITLKECKKIVIDKIKNTFGITVEEKDISWHNECWMDN